MTATAKSQGPLFTRRALFTLVWPLLLEQTLSVTMGMADTLMVAGARAQTSASSFWYCSAKRARNSSLSGSMA